jgi:hypothetical protein
MDWGGLILSYVTLKHFDGAVFNATGWRQFVREISYLCFIALKQWPHQATGNASDPFWAWDSGLEGVVAEFDVSDGKVAGFGLRGGIWGADTNNSPQGNTVEERSEVWFDTMGN